MTVPPVPSDDDLRGFLLGDLPPDRAEAVHAWLAADPTHITRLEQLSAHDSLTDALGARAAETSIPADTIERVIRGVNDALRDSSSASGSTPHPLSHGDTASFPEIRSRTEATPERLDHFRLIRELGRGGMGVVFEAEDEKLARRVAIKVLHPDVARKPDATARFLREARAAAAVEHQNVVPILHVGEDGGTPYLVMPLLKGESLDQRLKRTGALPAGEVVSIGRDVASGLAAAHAVGLVHRDLKPANVWLDAGSGRARILDFGLARLRDGVDALSGDGMLRGTPAYMAPEQLDGHPADAQSDLFALGSTLYECATGKRAFDGPTVTAVLRAVADHQPPAPTTVNPRIPDVVSLLIGLLLSKSPTERPSSADAVVVALSAKSNAPAASPTTTLEVNQNPPATSPATRRQLTIGCSVTLTFCLLIGVVLVNQLGDNATDTFGPTGPTDVVKGNKKGPKAKPLPPTPPPKKEPPPTFPAEYRGTVDVRIERDDGEPRLFRLNEPGALPMKPNDRFAIQAEANQPAYLYLVWIDPGPDVTGVYPWDATAEDWRGTRPQQEMRVSQVRLPATAGNFYQAWDAKPGIATVVLLICDKPLAVSDETIADWFKSLPQIKLTQRSETAAVWHENFVEVKEPLRLRAGFTEVGSADPFLRWQGALQKKLAGHNIKFVTTVSFARVSDDDGERP